ncbi:hypothetical protein [Aquirhabdus sp.]|uniref:hypothetical protein n=1 Tax=Aquirhabdus sp. TaxID=2824160 RepID=UPI00396CEE48
MNTFHKPVSRLAASMLLAALLSSCAKQPVTTPVPVVGPPPSSYISLNNNLFIKVPTDNMQTDQFGAYTFVLMRAKDSKSLTRDQKNRLQVLTDGIEDPFVVDSNQAVGRNKPANLNLFCIPSREDGKEEDPKEMLKRYSRDGRERAINIARYDFKYSSLMLQSISRHVSSEVIRDALRQKSGPFLVTTLKPTGLADQDPILFADLSDSTSETIKGLVESYRAFIFKNNVNTAQQDYFISFMTTVTAGMESRILTPDRWVSVEGSAEGAERKR